MLIRPFYLACLAHASYLLADERTRTAVVVDPQRDVDVYLEEARRLGVKSIGRRGHGTDDRHAPQHRRETKSFRPDRSDRANHAGQILAA